MIDRTKTHPLQVCYPEFGIRVFADKQDAVDRSLAEVGRRIRKAWAEGDTGSWDVILTPSAQSQRDVQAAA